MQDDLIDEYWLLIYLVLLDKGQRLFADGTRATALRLLDSSTTSSGATVNVYHRLASRRTAHSNANG